MAKDTCVMCDRETPYDFETHIDIRIGYIEGIGQLCSKCYDRGTDHSYIAVSKHIIYNTPNDAELGEKIRQIYWESLD